MTPHFRNPLLWARRIRQRRGYGVHSPFAFGLLENVVYEALPYYAFKELDGGLSWIEKFRVKRYLHLLFRLANYHHPSHFVFFKPDPKEQNYLTAACQYAKMTKLHDIDNGPEGDGMPKTIDENGENNLIFLSKPCDEALRMITPNSMLLLANVHQYDEWWRRLPSVVSFDLYDLGIAFFNDDYNKQDYIVNF